MVCQMITEERLKYYQKEVNLFALLNVQFLMVRAGAISSVSSTGITTIEYKINAGTYGALSFPISYAANDVITFAFSYTDSEAAVGSMILFGKDV